MYSHIKVQECKLWLAWSVEHHKKGCNGIYVYFVIDSVANVHYARLRADLMCGRNWVTTILEDAGQLFSRTLIQCVMQRFCKKSKSVTPRSV